jgi:hypothetical protein
LNKSSTKKRYANKVDDFLDGANYNYNLSKKSTPHFDEKMKKGSCSKRSGCAKMQVTGKRTYIKSGQYVGMFG